MLHTDSSGFGMHTDMTSGANEVHFGCSALSLPSSLDFVHMELVILIGTDRGGKFHTDLDVFEMHVIMTKGMNEVYSGCLVLCFISCLDFIRIKL